MMDTKKDGKRQNMNAQIEPIKTIRSRYSYYVCGCCGKKIARGRKLCWFCGIGIAWEDKG